MKRYTKILTVVLLTLVLHGSVQAPAEVLGRDATPSHEKTGSAWVRKCLATESVSLGFFLTLEPVEGLGGSTAKENLVRPGRADDTAVGEPLGSEDDPDLMDGLRRTLAAVRVFVELSLRILDHILGEFSWIQGVH